MYGSDQSASIEPKGLEQLVGAVRKIEKVTSDGKKRVLQLKFLLQKISCSSEMGSK